LRRRRRRRKLEQLKEGGELQTLQRVDMED